MPIIISRNAGYPAALPAPARRQGGSTLIEVLVTFVILAIGIMGLAGMQLRSLTFSQSALYRTTATGLAVSLFASCIFIGQSVGVAVGAITFIRFAPAWSFGAAAVGLLLLGLIVRRAVSSGQADDAASGDGGPLAS